MSDKKQKILIVDDDTSFRDAVSRLLINKGYVVVQISGSIPVIKTIIREKPDIILLDLFMPRVGGIEIIQMMNRLHLNIPVVIISGNLSPLYIRILQDRGISHFLAKPVGIKILMSKVREILEKNVIHED
ncbi:MAG: response regulator [Candidatus Latescibacteria bacterium]|jgi:DNA-binding NtrC family response regulator|nr:response regulator [Candidatus Latescibacterota bacterium]